MTSLELLHETIQNKIDIIKQALDTEHPTSDSCLKLFRDKENARSFMHGLCFALGAIEYHLQNEQKERNNQ